MRYRRITYSFFDIMDIKELSPIRNGLQLLGLQAPIATWWQPPADVYETRNELVIRVDLGGLSEDDFQVELYSDGLVVQGVRRPDNVPKDAVFHIAGIRYGPFRLAIAVPWASEAKKVDAVYEKGFLVVKISKLDGGKDE